MEKDGDETDSHNGGNDSLSCADSRGGNSPGDGVDRPTYEDRLLSGYLSITTDSPAKPEITVPIYGSPTN